MLLLLRLTTTSASSGHHHHHASSLPSLLRVGFPSSTIIIMVVRRVGGKVYHHRPPPPPPPILLSLSLLLLLLLFPSCIGQVTKWAVHYGGPGYDVGSSLAVDPTTGSVYLGAAFTTSVITLGPYTLTKELKSDTDMLLAKFSPTGNLTNTNGLPLPSW